MGVTISSSTESLGRNQAEEWSMAGREAPGAGRAFAGQAQPDRAGVRRARPRRHRPGSGGAVRGRVWPRRRYVGKRCEREKQEKEKAGPGTILAYVHQTDTSADEHKQAGLRGDRGTLCLSAT
jgi:hypothetical protein